MQIGRISHQPTFEKIRNIEFKEWNNKKKCLEQSDKATFSRLYLAEAMKKSEGIKKLQESSEEYDIKICTRNDSIDNDYMYQKSIAEFNVIPVNGGEKKTVFVDNYNYNGCAYESGLSKLAMFIEKCEDIDDAPEEVDYYSDSEALEGKTNLMTEMYQKILNSLKK